MCTVPRAPEFDPQVGPGPFCVVFALSLGACMCFLQEHAIKLIGETKWYYKYH